jgi:transketolase
MMGLHALYVFTHDSIGLGEDGPTHQPIDQLASLRAVPGLTVIRPCDANETAEAWRVALKNKTGPTALALTRQGLPVLDRDRYGAAAGLQRGGYTLADAGNEKPDLILIATGSEVHIALEAAVILQEKGKAVRVVSMPSWELFDSQPEDYRKDVLPPDVRARVAVEAGATLGWDRYVGFDGAVVGIDHFGASAPSSILFDKFGMTADKVVETALQVLEQRG